MSDTRSNEEPIPSETLDKHLSHIRRLIMADAVSATRVFEGEGTTAQSAMPREQDIWMAALKYAPGTAFSTTKSDTEKRLGFIERLFTINWTNTAVLTVLTLMFGILGLVGIGLIGQAKPDSEVAKQLGPFLDIAKIFAGAIVGAAGATAAAAAGSSRR